MTDAYYYWLIKLIGDGQTELCYQRLLWKLYTTPFFYELDYDRNRAVDGLQLRKKFMQSTGENCYLSERDPCTVLEMLIALAQRVELNFIYDPQPGDDCASWFWQMITNLNLDSHDDNYYGDDFEVDRILYKFMHHLYDSDGRHGGAFPCPGVHRDFRKTDLWWQLGAYFQQNAPMQIW